MKKIYALFFGLLAFSLLALVPAAQAQYQVTDYIVRTNHNTFVSIQGQGTVIQELTPTSQYWYERVSNEVTIPFNYRFVNLVTNKFKEMSDGSVICGGSATWPDGCTYDYGLGYYSFYEPFFNESQYGYGEFADELIAPFTTYAGAIVGSTTYSYLIQGTAPNRTCIVEASNLSNYYTFNNSASMQVVLYEVGPNSGFISKIDINYSGAANGNNWPEGGGEGLKDQGGCGNQYISIYGDNQNYADGSTPIMVTSCYSAYNNQYIPLVNYTFSILYDYNLAFSHPSPTPADGKILLINTPIVNQAVAPFINGPSISISNEGRLNFSAVNLRLVITGDPTNPYDHNVDLNPSQIPGPYGGVSPSIGFPNYTPVNYGHYTMTYTVNSSNPTDQFAPDNTFTTQFIISPPNNIAAVKPLAPAASAGTLVRTPINIPTSVAFEYQNLGVNNQTGVPVTIYITNPSGAVVDRDTEVLNNWLSGQVRDTDFKDFTPTQNGTYAFVGVSRLPGDQNPLDDTIRSSFQVAYEADAAAISIFNPDDQEEKPERKEFKPGAYFQSVGVTDLFNVPVRVILYRCSDNAKVFQADTLLPELNVDQGQVKMYFPSQQGIYDIAKLAPGCYQMCAIANQPGDGDRSNDTVCSFFSIIPRLEGNINVGVGQRFPTISAAVDSMQFRGVGPKPLNLILTDANYSENGTSSASSPFAAIDFTGITGTGPNTETGSPVVVTINWIPKKGVSPTITFTGSKANCFQWPYRSASYMTFDGNNQFAPTPDLVVAEPTKRGITIINQSTTPGSVFNLSFGRHDILLKNLKIRNNGNTSNAVSQAIHIENVFNQFSFLNGVMDSTPDYNITIDNNEISNANVGIYDVGTIPLFDLNQALFFDRRNNHNRITRNTIGTQAFPIAGTGIQIGNEDGLYIGHNEIGWISGYGGSTYGGAISANSGNSVNLWIDGNRIHNIRSTPGTANTLVGIDIQQASIIYTQGFGPSQKRSVLPVSTGNRITNNMIYNFLAGSPLLTTIEPITLSTGATNYFVKNDSVFNNSLAVSNAPALITMLQSTRPFIWDNILQNLNSSSNATSVLYNLTVPRPWASDISSDYNDIDFRNASLFANINEYDAPSGTFIQNISVRSLTDWRTYTSQDIHSVTGDPRFTSDSLHLPAATTYIWSPASNNGAWLNTGTQTFDFDGDQRLVANNTPDIGADEFDGFQFVNDLAVQTITVPGGITDNTGVVSVTAENPLHIQALVKNQGAIEVFNRNITATVEVSTDGGVTWSMIYSNSQTASFAVAETKTIDFTGPTISNEAGKLYRLTVSVPSDQNNANNSQQKIFKLLVKRAAVLLSYENSTARGQHNKDSLAAAFQRLGIRYDSLNRVNYGTGPIDYTPWWTVVWSTGDPTVSYNGALGVGAISLKEEGEIIRFFNAGQTYAKKSFVIAGENVAEYNDPTSAFYTPNNPITDNELMTNWLHTRFVARWPELNSNGTNLVMPGTGNSFRGLLNGVGSYFRFADSIQGSNALNGGGPNIVKVNPSTGIIGDNVSRVAYNYQLHLSAPFDSGAGTAWTGSTFNVVFYAFDWSDPLQTVGTMDGQTLPFNVSGTTRFLRGALDFIQSFHGTVLPVEFSGVKGTALTTGNEITWSVAGQKNVDHYEVEMLEGTDWNFVGQTPASSATDYSFLHTAQAAFEVGTTFTYRIVSVDLDGSRTTSMTTSFDRPVQGSEFSLDQNFPNPSSGSTTMSFTLPENGTVSLRILDMTGKVVATPISAVDYAAGKSQFAVNAAGFASGTYIYELSFVNGNGEVSKLSRKMTINK